MLSDGLFWDTPTGYDCPPLTDEMVRAAESALGCKLPTSYLTILKIRNGGILRRDQFTLRENGDERRLWLYAVFGLGGNEGIDNRKYGVTLNRYLIDQWRYPEAGLVFAHIGHAGFLLDYSECGPEGEPRVLYQCSEFQEPERFVLAPDFSSFLSRLERGSCSFPIGKDCSRRWASCRETCTLLRPIPGIIVRSR